LDDCIDTLLHDGFEKFRITYRNIHPRYPNNISLIVRNLPYPYDYFDDIRKYEEVIIPPREKFYNRLKMKECSEETYNEVSDIYTSLNIYNLKDLTLF